MKSLWFASLTIATCVTPVAARPHDETLSVAFHCATIGELRTWLDCYYGAAQPVRAALGMTPAPATQVRLTAAPPSGTPPPGDTALRDGVLFEAVRCGGQAEERQWLNCYYAAAAPVRARLSLASRSAPPLPSPAQVSAPRPFGTRAIRDEIPDTASQLSARMQSYNFDKFGIFTVLLENGQVWRQIAGDNDFARWKKVPGSYKVVIAHGFFGSYNLQVLGQPGLYKVRRAN